MCKLRTCLYSFPLAFVATLSFSAAPSDTSIAMHGSRWLPFHFTPHYSLPSFPSHSPFPCSTFLSSHRLAFSFLSFPNSLTSPVLFILRTSCFLFLFPLLVLFHIPIPQVSFFLHFTTSSFSFSHSRSSFIFPCLHFLVTHLFALLSSSPFRFLHLQSLPVAFNFSA